jgi:hypothetical protein
MSPVTRTWSTWHPPHITTKLCSSLPHSQHSSLNLQLWFPSEVITSRYYSVIPFVLNLLVSIQELFDLCRCVVPTCHNHPHFRHLISTSTGNWDIFLHRSSLLIVSDHLTRRILCKLQLIKVCNCIVAFLDTNHDSLAYNRTDFRLGLKILILVPSFNFL